MIFGSIFYLVLSIGFLGKIRIKSILFSYYVSDVPLMSYILKYNLEPDPVKFGPDPGL